MTRGRVAGGKTALVLLHGWGAHAGIWNDLASCLGGNFSVLAPDLPGHGAAPAAPQDRIEDIVDRLAADAPRRCAVAGWSLGGQLALAWARRHPQQVTRLILMATTPCFVGAPDWPQGMASGMFAEFSAALKADPDSTLARFHRLQVHGDGQSRAVAKCLEAAYALRPMPGVEVLMQTLAWLQATDLRAVLPGIRQPALVLQGTEDPITTRSAAEFLAKQLPHARIEWLAGAAHVPFMSSPDVVCSKMTEFCLE